MSASALPPDLARAAPEVAAAVAACPGVAALFDGPAATYLPGRVVRGVAVRDAAVVVSVVASFGPPLAEVARQVRAAASGVLPGLPVEVRIEDIADPVPDRAASR